MSAAEQPSGRLTTFPRAVVITTAALVGVGVSYVVAVQDPIPTWELDPTQWINDVPDALAALMYPIMQFGTLGGPILVAAAVGAFTRDW